MKQFLIAGNWKMQRPFQKTIEWCTAHKDKLSHLATNHELVICPTHTELYALAQLFASTDVHIGGQDCSQYDQGAYTGHVDAQSLKEIGCTYCIIGHSERRKYNAETNDMIAHKLAQLIKRTIQPIICIGETHNEYQQQKTLTALEQQLAPLLNVIQKTNAPAVCIAYEPVWAIGTGIIPEAAYLEKIFVWLHEKCANTNNLRLLYGGSVSPENASELKQIKYVDGFLIGGASLDFQKLEKIVSL